MARRTKRTIRRTPSTLARDLMRLGNTLDQESKRAHRLAHRVAELERNSVPVDQLRFDPDSKRFYVEEVAP